MCERQLLLVLDNCEHVLGAAPQIAEFLGACRQVKVLAASREPLRLRWEHELPVPPLTVPDVQSPLDVATLRAIPSVELFVQRAQAVAPSFALTNENAEAVARLCVRLDGLPLALELAAARTRLLSAETMLLRLEHRFSILTSEARDRPARHRTLCAAINWSYGLLDEDERALFRRLSMFDGGCTLEAIEYVGSTVTASSDADNRGPGGSPLAADADPPLASTLDVVGSLVDKSLLRREDVGQAEPRFVMLETIRRHARHELQVQGETDETARRHAEYYLALAEHAAPRLYTAEQHVWLSTTRGGGAQHPTSARLGPIRTHRNRAVDPSGNSARLVLVAPRRPRRRSTLARSGDRGDPCRCGESGPASATDERAQQGGYARARPGRLRAGDQSARRGAVRRAAGRGSAWRSPGRWSCARPWPWIRAIGATAWS